MTRLGPAARIEEVDADSEGFVTWSTRDLRREIDALKSLHETLKRSVGSDALAFGYTALLVLRHELSEIRRSIDSASRRQFNR